MRPYTLKIPAGSSEEIKVVGDYVRIRTATVPITVESPDRNERLDMDQGDDATLTPFERLRLSHADAGEQTVKFLVGRNTRAGSSKVGGAVSVSNFPATQPVSGTVNPVANGVHAPAAKAVSNVSVQLLAANANRKYLAVQNQHASAKLYVRGDGAAATADAAGIRIDPGQTWEPPVAPTGAVNAIMDAATAGNTVHVIEA